jgi:hypothetical protein
MKTYEPISGVEAPGSRPVLSSTGSGLSTPQHVGGWQSDRARPVPWKGLGSHPSSSLSQPLHLQSGDGVSLAGGGECRSVPAPAGSKQWQLLMLQPRHLHHPLPLCT